MFITKKRHEALIAIAEAQRDKETLRANGLAAEAAALTPDAEKYRRSVANLKQNRKVA